jgi:UDP-GlcNAc:undecaprenyl-phosphate GlcNAc-1-phosphate transferase
MGHALESFGIALVLSLLLVPLVRHISFRIGRVAIPREDRWHSKPTPTLGGLAIFAAFTLSLAVGFLISPEGKELSWGFLLGSVLMFATGLYDEFRPIPPSAKLVLQILAATLIILLGYTSTFFTPKISNNLIAQFPNILFTFIWLVGITNAINLLDNMDGLAGGISFITAGVLSFFFWRLGDASLLWVAMALAGSTLGFLIFNFPPAKIFMGDSGSLFLGFTLAVLAIAQQQQQQASNVLAVLGAPTLIFLLPILDTVLVTFTRLLRGQSPVKGGRDHTSHRLIAFGLSERQALVVLYSVALISAILAAALESLSYWLSLFLAPFLILSLALFIAYLGRLKVVTSPQSSLIESAPPNSGLRSMALTRLMIDLTYRRRVLEALLDFFLIGIAYYLAFLIRYGLGLNEAQLELFLQSLPLALACSYLSFFVFGVYRGVWRYVDFDDLLRYAQASLGSLALMAGTIFLLGLADRALWRNSYSHLTILLFAVFLFLGLAASRSSFVILDRFSGQRTRQGETHVLICGAGDAGEMALRWILTNPSLHYRPIGFLDEDLYLRGRQIHGVEVLGGSGQLSKILEDRQVGGVIMAGIDPCSGSGKEIITTCHQQGCWVRHLRLEFEEVKDVHED